MPVHAVRSAGGKIIGWQFGTTGKIYKTEKEAQRAIRLARSGLSKEIVKQKVKEEFYGV